MSDIIQIRNLSKHFGNIVGVNDVTLDINEGEFVTILGPSGCGKSTLLRMIAGFEQPTQGRIFLDQKDVTNTPANKRQVNMVFQDYALFPHLKVGANVGYGLKVNGVNKSDRQQPIIDALNLVGLSDKIDNMPHELSGGQRQRVALARALVRRPKVLLLDEPLSALDANLREQMQVELRHLHKKVGLTFIMVTHDQTEAMVMSQRVVVMKEGQIAQMGTPSDLYDHPENSYVANFIGTTNLFSSTTTKIGSNQININYFGQPLQIAANDKILPSGTEQIFGFRPEKTVLIHGHQQATNGLQGKVKEVLYQGLAARILVNVGAGEIAIDQMLSETKENAHLPSEGDQITIEIDPHKIMVIEQGHIT